MSERCEPAARLYDFKVGICQMLGQVVNYKLFRDFHVAAQERAHVGNVIMVGHLFNRFQLF